MTVPNDVDTTECLLHDVDAAIELCTFADALDEGDAYDNESGDSTIHMICGESKRPKSAPKYRCYALDAISVWVRVVMSSEKWALFGSDLDDNIENDLCYQTLLNGQSGLDPQLVKSLTNSMNILCVLLRCKVMALTEKTPEHDDDCSDWGPMASQISTSMEYFKILLRVKAIDLQCSTMHPKPEKLVDLMMTVHALRHDHPLRCAVLEEIYSVLLQWMESDDIPHGIVTVRCYPHQPVDPTFPHPAPSVFVSFLGKEDMFQELLFRGFKPFAFSLGCELAHIDYGCCLKCNQWKPQQFRSTYSQLMSYYDITEEDMTTSKIGEGFKEAQAILPLNAPLVIFPYLKQAKQQMYQILMDTIKSPEISGIIVSLLFVEGREAFYGENSDNLDYKALEFLNWIRMMSSSANGPQHGASSMFKQRFDNDVFAEHLTSNQKYLSLCVRETRSYQEHSPDLLYLHKLMVRAPPTLKVYMDLLFDVLGFKVCFPSQFKETGQPMDELIIDWLKHIESTYPEFDINYEQRSHSDQSAGNLLNFAIGTLQQWMSMPGIDCRINPSFFKLVDYLMKNTESKLNHDDLDYTVLLGIFVKFGKYKSMEILSEILEREGVEVDIGDEEDAAAVFMKFVQRMAEIKQFLQTITWNKDWEDVQESFPKVIGEYLDGRVGILDECDVVIEQIKTNLNTWIGSDGNFEWVHTKPEE